MNEIYKESEAKMDHNPKEARIDRMIENMPLQIAENLKAYFILYKAGEINRKELKKKFDTTIWTLMDTTCNTIDGAMGRPMQ